MQVPSTSSSTAAASVSAASSSSSSSSSSTAASAATAATVDYNSFLKLLVAQLKNQDPTSPTDPTQYMAQLASFSAVGQSIQTNQKLDTLLTTTALSQADAIIGHKLTSVDGQVNGTVKSVVIGNGGVLTALLDSGMYVQLGSGIIVS